MVRVTVIGCGLLGIKVAGSLAFDGNEVRIYDSNAATLNKVYLRLNEDRRIYQEDGLMPQKEFIGDVYCLSNLADAVRNAEFIFESIDENISNKKDILSKIELHCNKEAVITTSSMRLSIDELAEVLTHKDRFLGLRFLYPVYFIPEVELVPSKVTSLETLEKVRRFLERQNRVAFFRSGNEPIVLNEEQREARKIAFIRQLIERKGIYHRLNQPVPDLTVVQMANNAERDSLIDNKSDLDFSYNREKECVICMDNQRDCVLHPCHHLCTCITCGRLLLKRQDACPICRRNITNAFRVYHS